MFTPGMSERGVIPKTMRKEWTAWRRAVFLSVAGLWHRAMRPKHFEFSAFARYGYAKRDKYYQMRKARLKRTTAPLVWSGRSKQLAALPNIRSTRNGGSVSMRAPTLNLKAGPGAPDMRAELTKLLPEEKQVLAKHAQQELDRFFARAEVIAASRSRLV